MINSQEINLDNINRIVNSLNIIIDDISNDITKPIVNQYLTSDPIRVKDLLTVNLNGILTTILLLDFINIIRTCRHEKIGIFFTDNLNLAGSNIIIIEWKRFTALN